MAKPYFFRINSAIETSNLLPPIRIEVLETMPPNEIIAISEVPPPISTTICPEAEPMGISAPIAAAIGSLIM